MRAALLAVAFLGCHPEGIQQVRFVNRPPVMVVDDRRDVPTPPETRVADHDLYAFRVSLKRPVDQSLEVPRHVRAQGVSSLDEVPDSTWFTNRHDLTPDEIARGPLTDDSPALHMPWTVVASKFGGSTLGFIVVDTRGTKYLMKLDFPQMPELETGTEAVIDRLLWACGYNVPEDEVVYFTPDQLVLPPGGKVTPEQVTKTLDAASRAPDGRYRALASRWLPGKPVGPSPTVGVRDDDPNDRIAHERRRDLRGMSVVYAWLDIVDIWPGNLLDMWQEHGDRHYLVHYLLDFNDGLGVFAHRFHDARLGKEYTVDWEAIGNGAVTLGIEKQPWESRPIVHEPSASSLFTVEDLDPGDWREALQYAPFQEADRFDSFWGAKLIAKFTRDDIRAAVLQGQFSEPRGVEYLVDTLVGRQRKLVAYWYARVNPLDKFAFGSGLCFDDLAITQGYVPAGTATLYVVNVRDAGNRPLAPPMRIPSAASGHTCLELPALAAHRGYTIVDIATRRPGQSTDSIEVHVGRDPTGAPRVIGLWRP